MPNDSDRARVRNDLRELARLAKEGFATADSSGFVDLAALSEVDPNWVERELARTRAGSPPPVPPSAPASPWPARSAESVLPVSVDPPAREDTARRALRPKRTGLYVVLASASIVGVGALAFVVSRNAPPGATDHAAAAMPGAVTATAAASAVEEPPVSPPSSSAAAMPVVAAASVAAPEPSVRPSVNTAPATAVVAAARPAGAGAVMPRRTAPAVRAPAASPPVAAAKPAAAASPQPTQAKPSGDSLLDLIRSSVAKGK
jgi:hypothetical protein